MKKIKYALFYDFHTLITIPDVGKFFDADKFTDEVKACGVDFLTWHARCNQGNAYYDTQYGLKHPALKTDMIRDLAENCRRKDILFSVYFNGHLSDEELLQHRDWITIQPNGAILGEQSIFTTPYLRRTCYNSPYREHLKKMTLELLQNYPIDGFFYDCVNTELCICEHCMKEMKERNIDFTDKKQLHEFARSSVYRFCRELTDEIRQIKPDALIFFNGRPFEEVIDIESHLECECLPTAFWGYETLPICAHYMRTVAGKDKQVLNMTGRFNDWGDFGGLRTAAGLKYDMLYGVANGMRPDIGGHFHPRGDMDMPVFERIKEVFGYLRQFDKWVIDAVNLPETAVVGIQNGPKHPEGLAVTAAVRMLTELKIQFDLVTEFSSWDQYKLLIFPDDIPFTPEIVQRVEKHLAKGGKILASGRSGLEPDGKKFALKDWPVEYAGIAEEFDPLYFQPRGELAEGIEKMPLSVYAQGCLAHPSAGSVVHMNLVKPYVKFGFDGLRSNFYVPPEKETDYPFAAEKNNIIYISGKIFSGYGTRAPVQLKTLIGNCIKKLDDSPLLKVKNFPSFSRAFLQEHDNSKLVHILAYSPEKRCEAMALEDEITLVDLEFSIRCDGKNITRVYSAPDEKPVEFSVSENYCTIRLPRVDGYALIVAEFAG